MGESMGVGCGHHTNGRTFGHCVFSIQQAQNTADLQWNRVSVLEAEALPLGHRPHEEVSEKWTANFHLYKHERRSINPLRTALHFLSDKMTPPVWERGCGFHSSVKA
ncbi:hypothetical protein AVEN_198564-1 [Araneus ventricosus]|uniref:Uncharacterized protein n=1 Tax=Araneus ventricosus TaxID=182803 RepID=A0A4Y2VL42_ARAVE|nr:hypothetical protein AVEN_198564-1 [Araneus ventricosus]